MGELKAEIYDFWIGQTPGIGIVKAKRMVEAVGSLEALYNMKKYSLEALHILNCRELEAFCSVENRKKAICGYEDMKKKEIACVSFFSERYPDRLRSLARPPLQLFYKGEMPDSGKKSLGIVGARECSCYGRDMARMFGYRLAQAGIRIVSGMARGIDGWAHQGALEGGGKTFAVLGSGADVCYPAIHKKLYRGICKKGGVISEYPPGTMAKPQYFPMRNRLISGLSDGILIVEAKARSGSLITAETALDQGCDVFVIPGRIGDELSVGCNRLILQGAIPVLSPSDILEYYHMEEKGKKKETLTQSETMEKRILDEIKEKTMRFETLCDMFSASPTDVMKILNKLRKEGKVREKSRGNFEAF